MKKFTQLFLALLVLTVAGTATQASDPPGEAEDKNAPKNTLRWTTAGEFDNFGFDVFRATDKEGPFKLRTVDPIPGAGTTDLTHKYIWVDKEIDPTVTYYYYVESISLGGIREHFTPVITAPAKSPRTKTDASPD